MTDPDPRTDVSFDPLDDFDALHLHGARSRTRARNGADIDVVVAGLATAQEGVVDLDELTACGMSRGERRHRLASGRLFRAHRGVYLVGHEATTFRGRGIAALRACGEHSVLSRMASAAGWEIAPAPATLDVIVPPRSRRPKAGVRIHHATLRADEIAVLDGLRLTTPARTLLDLAAVVPAPRLERLCADALVAQLLTQAELQAAVERARGRRGIVALRAIVGSAEPTRSDVERAFLRALREAGLPRPLVNTPLLVDGHGRIQPDFLWRRERVIVETDAFGTHGHAAAFESDRARDAALHALGWIVLRLTRRQIKDSPHRVTVRVAQVLAQRVP
jgi:very-short-patch-repair endonuclease